MSTGPALLNPRCGTRESARVGGRHLDSPSTTVRLGHLAGIYNCLDSKSHRPFVLEFSLRPGSQCPPLRDLSSPSRTSPRPTGEIIPQPAGDGKRGLRLVSHFSGSRTPAESIGFARSRGQRCITSEVRLSFVSRTSLRATRDASHYSSINERESRVGCGDAFPAGVATD